jgi:acetyltransferase-like isoleucine patch superfamily enzyme
LTAFVARIRADVRAKWARDLPPQELVSDRWARAASLGFGEGASIYASSYVYGDVRVGPRTWIGPNTLLDGSGGLTIGQGCDVSAGVQIYTHDTVRRVLSEGSAEIDRASVSVGDFTHLGAGVTVLKGVTIGDHCVVGAHSLVRSDIPPYSVSVGVPSRVVGRVVVDDGGAVTLDYAHQESADGATG